APLARNLASLVLYEPPLCVHNVSARFLEHLDDLARRGDLETLLTEFLVDFVGLEPEVLDAERRLPDWGIRVRSAATIPRELRAAQDWQPNTESYRKFAAPTLFLL